MGAVILAVDPVPRLIGAVLGSRADRLPPLVRRGLSLERRSGFAPLDLDAPGNRPSMEPQAK